MAEPTPAPSGIGVDSSQVLAVSAGVIGGTLVAGLLAEGLIVPIYCWATGSGGAAGAGAGAGLIHGVIRTVGAVGGGLYGNAWYRSHGEAATAVAQ